MANSNGKFTPETKQSGDLIQSADWNAAMQEIVRLETGKVNRNGADTLKGSLTIQEALNVTGNVTIGVDSRRAKLDVKGSLSVTETLNFGSSTRQMLNLYNMDYGIGIQNSTQYFRTNSNFAWYKGGSHNDTALNPGGGTVQMVIKDNNVGIGTDSPEAKLEVNGDVKITGRISTGGKFFIKTFYGTFLRAKEGGIDAIIDQNINAGLFEQFTLEMACSRELKENISNLSTEEALATLDQLNPVKYNYKKEKSFRKNLGFIAEEMPDNLASCNKKTFSPFEIIPILTQVVKEQQKTILMMQSQLQILKTNI